jgi:hypothetical protein
MEHRLQQRLEPSLDNHLCYSVRHRRDAQRPCPAITLRYVNAHDWWRQIAARSHPIPDPVQVLAQILFELGNRDPVATGRTGFVTGRTDFEAARSAQIDLLADVLDEWLDMAAVDALIAGGVPTDLPTMAPLGFV